MSSYLLEYVIIFIGICRHIYWNMSPYLLEYVIHIYWNMSSYSFIVDENSDKNYIPNITCVKFL